MRIRGYRQWAVRLAVIAAVGLMAAAAVFGVRLLSLGAAYKAKMLCSEVFVAGRNIDDALADLEVDDLKQLRVVSASIDRIARTAKADALFGLVERQAVYRGDVGCSAVFGGVPTPSSAPNAAAMTPLSLPKVDDHRLDALLERAFSEPDPERPRRTRAVVVVHGGRIVAERYAPGFGPDSRLAGWSMSKSVLNAFVGIMVGAGRLSLRDPVSVGEWTAAGDRRARITLDDLLRMSSGLRFDEDMSRPLTHITRMLFHSPDMAAFAASQPLDADPGTRWQYSSGSSMIVSRIIRSAMNQEEYRRFPRAALFDRIGMTGAVLETDASGTYAGSSFMYATARDWARFGMLYLQDGVWNGERILPPGWVAYSRAPAPADPQRAYGAHFWLQIPEEYRGSSPLLPADTFHAAGHEAQFITIVPSRRIVMVRLGKTRYPETWDHDAFVDAILRVLEERTSTRSNSRTRSLVRGQADSQRLI